MSQALATTGARYTERSIQDALYFFCFHKRHRFMVPNVQMFGWESDFVSVTRDGYVYEYEIKISRKDFLQEFQKARHLHLTDPKAGEAAGLWPATQPRGANYLYYATPAELLRVDEIPTHAGLITVSDTGLAQMARPAPKLHKDKLSDHHRQWLERSLTCRFWHERLRGKHADT